MFLVHLLIFSYILYYLILQDAYRFISEEDKQKIAAQVENFRTEKSKFDREVAKWDDTGNDVIVLAKQMCMIMMEMTDFTRYLFQYRFCYMLVTRTFLNQLINRLQFKNRGGSDLAVCFIMYVR